MNDLALDPDYAGIVNSLRVRILESWDPEDIDRRMQIRRARKDVISAWARHIEPDEQYRWQLDPQMNRLNK